MLLNKEKSGEQDLRTLLKMVGEYEPWKCLVKCQHFRSLGKMLTYSATCNQCYGATYYRKHCD